MSAGVLPQGRGERGRGTGAVSWPCPLPVQEGVSGELVRERQHRERPGWLQGGTKSTTKGMNEAAAPRARPAPPREPGQGTSLPLLFSFRTANA